MSFRLAPLAVAVMTASALCAAPVVHAEANAVDAGAAPAATDASPAAASLPATHPAPAPVTVPDTPADIPVMVVTGTSLSAPLTVQADTKLPRQPLPAQDGADYLKTIPGFAVTRKGGADGDPVFRGQAGSRLALLADGQAVLGGCNARMDAPTAYIYPETFDALTVIKGPQSVSHGPVGSAGTLLFERNSERFAAAGAKIYASATAASHERQDLVLDARLGAPAGYLAVQGSDSRSDDYKDGNGVRVHSRYHRYNAGAALGWTPDDDTLVELSATQSDGEAAYADRAMDGTKFLREAVALRAEKQHLTALVEKVELNAYTSRVDHVMDDQELRKPGMMGYANLLRDTDGGRLAAALRMAEESLLTVGADLQQNDHSGRSAMPGMPYSALKADASFRQAGVFAELRQDLSPQRRLLAGARADRWEARDERATIAMMMPMPPAPNPSAGHERRDNLGSGFARLEQQLESTPVLAYAGFGHAERFPDYWELIARQAVTSLSGFDTLRPERTDQIDLGALYQADGLKASASLFYGRIADYILIDYNAKASGAARNIDATIWGGEIGADYRVAPQWMLSPALSYVRGHNDSNDADLPQQPPLEGRLGLAWDNRTWSLGLLGRFVAEQDRFRRGEGTIVGKDLGRSGGFSVFSVNGGWRPVQGLLLSAGVDNVFDKAYAEFVSRAGGNGMGGAIPGYAQTARVNEPGRTAWLKLTWRQ